jgi:uncharacterized membrane protein
MYMCAIFMILILLLVYMMPNALHICHSVVDIPVDVSHHAATFICMFWKPPHTGEVLSTFLSIYVRGWRIVSGCIRAM